MSGLMKSIKNLFWFSPPDDLENESHQGETMEDHDAFYLAEDAQDYEERLRAIVSYFDQELQDPDITVEESAALDSYMKLSVEVDCKQGELRLVYYDNDELILRGEPELVSELIEPVQQRLVLAFRRV